MKSNFDIELLSKIVMTLIVAAIIGSMFTSMIKFSEKNTASQSEKIREVINKALVQCYALEGSYPTKLEYLEKYGVIIDNQRYVYDFTFIGSNIIPDIRVQMLGDVGSEKFEE